MQRVQRASVKVNGEVKGAIGPGLLLFLGVQPEDNDSTVDWAVKKISHLRVFSDENGKMNLSVQDVKGGVLVVSQFTLCADLKKGNRPSFVGAAPPQQAEKLYESFARKIGETLNQPAAKGVFGADMAVELINDGPVTLWLESPVVENQGLPQ